MIYVYIYRTAETLVYHMHTATELAALVAAFQSMDGWDRIEAIMPGEPRRTWTAPGRPQGFHTIRHIGKLGPVHVGATIGHDPDLGEYRVRFSRACEELPDADYFTDSLEDATGRASAELERMTSAEPPQAG